MPFVVEDGPDGLDVDFASPIRDIVLAPLAAPTIASAPTAGAGLALNESGKLSPALLASAPDESLATGDLALSTTYTDITDATTTVADPGTYIALAAVDADGTATGWGDINTQLLVDGVAQSGIAVLGDDGSANCQATIAQVWLVLVVQPRIVFKLQAKKTINAGTATVRGTNTKLIVFRIA